MTATGIQFQPLPKISPDQWPQTLEKTNLDGILLIRRPVFPDPRGDFHESFRRSEIERVLGFFPDFCQGNESRNKMAKVLRGLHIAPWYKLVHCSAGAAFVIIVDCRLGSPMFGQTFTQTLDENNRFTILVPPGCAHGYLTLVKNTNYSYLASEEWNKDREVGISYADPLLKINYPIGGPFLVSEKDAANPMFREVFP